ISWHDWSLCPPFGLIFRGDNYPAIGGYQLTPNQIKRWKEYSNKKAEWKYTRTCASWASNAIYYVVNEDVDADDLFGFETPRELSIHIIELEKKNNTSLLYPYISNQDNSRSF
uniref:hypothetical protein n=1 Tax=Psychrobacter okhotskensis TaxID=212403 RepID=UPI00191A14CA